MRAIVSHGQVQTDARMSGLCATQRGEVRAEAEAGPDGGGRRGQERRQLRGGIARAHTARWSQGHSQDWGRCNCTLVRIKRPGERRWGEGRGRGGTCCLIPPNSALTPSRSASIEVDMINRPSTTMQQLLQTDTRDVSQMTK